MKAIFILLMFLSAFNGQSQFPEYFIDLFSGDVKLKTPGKKPIPVKMKMLIFSEDHIIIGKKGGQVTLVNKDRLYKVLNQQGVYAISGLSKISTQKPDNITSKFFYFLWKELLDPGHARTGTGMHSIAGSVGGGTRSTCELGGTPPDEILTQERMIEFAWNSVESSRGYQFSLFDNDNLVLMSIIMLDTTFKMDSRPLIKSPENHYTWSVESIDHRCSDPAKSRFIVLSEDEYSRQTQEIIKSVPRQQHSHYFLDISKKFYEKGFFKLADEYFNMALVQNN